jgi:acyl-CoA synthetase (AMP-forming)/AMP-acid ligase II
MNVAFDTDHLLARFAAQLENTPDALAFAAVDFSRDGFTATRVTVRTLAAHMARATANLEAASVKPGDRVVLSLDDPRRFVPFALAALARGCTIVPLPSLAELGGGNARAERVRGVLLDATPSAVVATDTDGWFSATESLRPPPRMVDAATADGVDASYPRIAFHRPSPHDPAVLQYTSGSTGDPKGVIVTHENLLANCHGIGTAGCFTRRDTMLSWLPLHHDMGLVGGVFSCLYWGVPTYLLRPRSFIGRPVSWLAGIAQFGATITVAPTFAYALAARRIPHEQLAGLDLSRLRLAFVGAEPIDVDALRAFGELLAPYGFDARALFPAYGLAEATLAVSLPEPGSALKLDIVRRGVLSGCGRAEGCDALAPDAVTFVAVGRAVPGLTVRIAHTDSGQTCPERTVGEIRVVGSSISPGYFGHPQREGELCTGDLGYVADGKLYVIDRLKDLVIVAGQNYSPADIERALLRIEGLRTARAVAFSVQGEGSEALVVVAEIEPRSHRSLDAVELEVRRAVLSRIGLALHRFVPVAPGTFELTTSGKLRRRACRDAFLTGRLAAYQGRATPADERAEAT